MGAKVAGIVLRVEKGADGRITADARWEQFSTEAGAPKAQGSVEGKVRVGVYLDIADNVTDAELKKVGFNPLAMPQELLENSLAQLLEVSELATAAPVDRAAPRGSNLNPIDASRGGTEFSRKVPA